MLMIRVMLIEDRDSVAELIVKCLHASPLVEICQRAAQQEDGFGGHLSGGYAGVLEEQGINAVVYSPPLRRRRLDLADAESVLRQCARVGVQKFILLSSAMVYGASPHNQGLIPETRPVLNSDGNQIASDWYKLETMAVSYLGAPSRPSACLTILRLAAMPARDGADYFSELFRGRIAVTLPGHDPTMQLLSREDLAGAVRAALEAESGGVYNLAPSATITLRAALRLAGVRRVPVSRVLQRTARRVLKRIGLAHPIEQLDFVRYSWTISDQKIRNELSALPQRSSVQALTDFRSARNGTAANEAEGALARRAFDDFGMDRDYIAAYGRTMFKFLHDYWWRVEVDGLDHVPHQGRAVLVGLHRGFMPWDGVMALHLLVQKLGRYPRFLIHPGLIKFPFLFNYMTKLGGIIACQENAAYVLERDEMLGLFPEGIRGAFALYRDAYKIGKFGRDEYVKIALRHRAPIVPFVTIGSAEIFPILKKWDWSWWKRNTEWPTFPITPTFPFLPPVPLPAKWHTQFLEPIHIEQRYPPEAATDPATVRAISREVRSVMEKAVGELLRRRKSIFYGSIFTEQTGKRRGYEKSIIYKEELS
jgi:1-acyl-sn-glycerol-3-phosphate acyltransferase/nucleoside-diphosphate-sugar epimerase